jgi:MFS family permease
VLIGGLIGTALSYLLFGFARSMPLLFASRLLAGFFGANISTAFAYVADVTTPENRAKGMGLIGAAFGLGFTLGPLVGGELTVLHPSYPGFFAAGLSLTAAIFGFFKLPEPPAAERTGSRVFGFDELRLVLSDGRIGLVLLLSFLAIVAFSSFEVLFIRFGLAEFPDVFGVPEAIASATTEQVLGAAPIAGRYLAFVGILAALIQGGLIRRLVPRFGETSLIVAGPLFLALGLGMVGVASAWWMVLAACALMPFGFGINNPSLNSLLSRASPDAQQGAILGIGQSLASLARLVAPVTAYALFDRYDAHTPFLVAAGLLVLAAAIAAFYRARYGATFQSPS